MKHMDNTTIDGEMTNLCTCLEWEEGVGYDNEIPARDCWGTCWEQAVEDFAECTADFRATNTTGWWKVTDLALWNRTVSGYFYAQPNDVEEIINGMTVNSEWTMRWQVFDDHVHYSLSHHDALGSDTTLEAVTQDEVDEQGLYLSRRGR